MEKVIEWWNSLSYKRLENLAEQLYKIHGAESGICGDGQGADYGDNPIHQFLLSDSISPEKVFTIYKNFKKLK